MAAGDVAAPPNPGSSTTETKEKGQYRWYTTEKTLKMIGIDEFTLTVDASTIKAVTGATVSEIVQAINEFLGARKGQLFVQLTGVTNQAEHVDNVPSIWCHAIVTAELTLPAGMAFSGQLTRTANAAKAVATINRIGYDETAGETEHDPLITFDPVGKAAEACTVSVPAGSAPPVGLQVTAVSTNTSTEGNAIFNWSSPSKMKISIKTSISGTIQVVDVGAEGSVEIEFGVASVSAAAQVFSRSSTSLQEKIDKWERTISSTGEVIDPWHEKEIGTWKSSAYNPK
jgi:hypothetical protein